MDDDDVLLESDPLAIYLKNQDIKDFQTIKIYSEDKCEEIHQLRCENKTCNNYEDFLPCLDKILKSELLLEEDCNILQNYFSYNLVSTTSTSKIIFKTTILSSLAFIGFALYKYTNLKCVKLISPICSVPIIFKFYNIFRRKLKNRSIAFLLQQLKIFTNLIKKCIRLVTELSATIGFYSAASINISSIYNVYIRFVKELYAVLLNIIRTLVYCSMEITSLIPLTIENNMQYGIKEDLLVKDDISITDLKLLFELYLLVQSDFMKTLGLSFCSYLWSNPSSDINKITKVIIPVLSSLTKKIKLVENEYSVLRNYDAKTRHKESKVPKKFNNSPSNYIISCLHSTEFHFQQLLCKSRDLQEILKDIEELQNNEKTQTIEVVLSEMATQINASKMMLEGATKYLNQIQNKSIEAENKVTMPQRIINSTLKTVEDQEEDLTEHEKLTYELYIPKEGLNLVELDVDSHRPVFSIKDLDYSGVLLEELRTILKLRNPEIFEEQQCNKLKRHFSDSEDDETFFTPRDKQNDIFRPSQPIGLAENLQAINQMLATRKNMLQSEELCEDTFGTDDLEEIIDEN